MYKYAAEFSFALLVAVAGCSGQNPAVTQASAETPSPSGTGARSFDSNCVPCHQSDARGIAGVYPSLVGSPVLLGDPMPLARWVIKGQRPPSLPVGRYPTAMLRFGWMKASEAAALFTYLRSHFGNAASPVDAASVAQALQE